MTIFHIKFTALIFMVLDHIYKFFPGTTTAFSMLGSISAPLFTFAFVEGIKRTKNKKSHFLRIYIYSIIVEISTLLLIAKSKEYSTHFNIIRDFVNIYVVIYLMEKYNEKGRFFNKGLEIYIIYNLAAFVFVYLLAAFSGISDSVGYYLTYMLFTVLPTAMGLDGGLLILALGIVFYYFKDNKDKLSLGVVILGIVNLLLFNTNFSMRVVNKLSTIWFPLDMLFINIFSIFFNAHPIGMTTDVFIQNSWIFVFSLIFIKYYNGKRGYDSNFIKYFFYVFYPLHLWIIYYFSL